MTYVLDGTLPGVSTGHKRISSNYVVPKQLIDLTSSVWNSGTQNLLKFNSLIPQVNRKISVLATYIELELEITLLASGVVGNQGLLFTAYFDTIGVTPCYTKNFECREFVAGIAANTPIYTVSGKVLVPVIGPDVLISTFNTTTGNAGNNISKVTLIGYYDSMYPV